MIAIAGAKGGCGKTVTTLGLAEAFARTGASTVAVDADRQLPNLHVTGAVDREPTLAALEAPRATTETESIPDRPDVETIAQESPRIPTAGIVPAPTPSAEVDVESVLADLADEDVHSFVDCPSGAGPDVIEPLSAADGVIVVTTGSERSVTAAETTLEMARRLEVPILGVVLNRCESVPAGVDSWIDVPILGLVPETDDPLTDEETRSAYDEIVETLRTRNATIRTPPEYDDDLLATGIEPLDRRLGGGLQPGTVVALVAEPASQSEQCLYEMTAPRGTLYLTTERSTTNVRRAVESTAVETGTPTIRHVSGDDALADAGELLETLPDGATLLVDPIAELERRDRRAYVAFLNELKERLVETESIAVLHCLSEPTPPANRTATTHAADAVFEVRTTAPALESRSGVDTGREQYLSVAKFRADGAFTATVELAFDGTAPEPLEPRSDAR